MCFKHQNTSPIWDSIRLSHAPTLPHLPEESRSFRPSDPISWSITGEARTNKNLSIIYHLYSYWDLYREVLSTSDSLWPDFPAEGKPRGMGQILYVTGGDIADVTRGALQFRVKLFTDGDKVHHDCSLTIPRVRVSGLDVPRHQWGGTVPRDDCFPERSSCSEHPKRGYSA